MGNENIQTYQVEVVVLISHKITRKCVATGDENEESDLGSIRLIVVNSVWGAK